MNLIIIACRTWNNTLFYILSGEYWHIWAMLWENGPKQACLLRSAFDFASIYCRIQSLQNSRANSEVQFVLASCSLLPSSLGTGIHNKRFELGHVCPAKTPISLHISLCCPHENTLDLWLPTECLCKDSDQTALGAHAVCRKCCAWLISEQFVLLNIAGVAYGEWGVGRERGCGSW